MGPLNDYLTNIMSIDNYEKIYNSDLISKIKFDFLLKFLYSNIESGYDDFKTNFVNQLINPHLNVFFTDQFIEILFMRDN